ncbi:uncharacterized protein LOC123317051 [Coccinella septempunctata]|uniref:uncharacterized protein LOC123317051 n=1 Tax=Coccinella septempunctata TaxID=41139 RepID=UPI001D06159F|nr:uncharacterized protein LOC123317051 [Coccinella septempunctata]
MVKIVELVFRVWMISFFADFTMAIECYTCSTIKDHKACEQPEKYNIPRKLCNKSSLNDTLNLAKEIDPDFREIFEVELSALDPMEPTTCLKQITLVGEKHVILRGCQLLAYSGNLNVCYKVKKHQSNNLRTTFCELCNTKDGCNSSKNLHLSYGLLVLTLLTCLTNFINT